MTEQARSLAKNLLARHGEVSDGPRASRPEPRRTRAESDRATTTVAVRRAGKSYFADHLDVVSTNQQFEEMDATLDSWGIPRPYFHPHLGPNSATVRAFGRELSNFSSYDYLGMSADRRVQERAKDAIDSYGTSVSASRIVSGEIPLHGELESRLARSHGVDDALVTTSGYLTNAAVVGYLLGPDDVAVCDSLVHSSIVSGTRWSGCRRISFRHNDPESLEAILAMSRHKFARAMLIVEGLYSMDGDTPPLPELIAIARRYDCAVMVDEAHSYGVLGATGKGIQEVWDLPGDAVDIWMGTLSKALGSCGGFLAGDRELIRALKYSAPGLSNFAIGAAPAAVGAALAAMEIIEQEPERVARVQARGRRMGELCREYGIDIGTSQGTPVTPVILAGKAGMASIRLNQVGINVGAILAPAVPAGQERLRFFVTSEHTVEQLRAAVTALDFVIRDL
jgi:8-amino-7-oxononanoate synthase